MTVNVGRARKSDRRIARDYRCFIDGVEVTNNCYYADTRRGVVRIFKSNNNGMRFIDRATGSIAVEERRGRVTLVRRNEATR